jgi:hypothetical protein
MSAAETGLSLLKIISGRSNDAIRTKLASPRLFRIVAPADMSVCLWSSQDACGFHYNMMSKRLGFDADGARQRSKHDPGIRAEAIRSVSNNGIWAFRSEALQRRSKLIRVQWK